VIREKLVGMVALSFGILSIAQVPDAPRFEQFPVTEKFSGTPAVPVLSTARDRRFRTMIRRGAAEGPNFAGHVTITYWGCGTGCREIAVIDARTGEINHDLPRYLTSSFLEFPDGTATADDGFEALSYRRDSRLLIVRGCPSDRNCALFYYEWTGAEFRLLRKLRATPNDRA